ncbi:helix-turn-helix domain-containing protein [Companilactobacillus mishanensis]|uniref:helix-turn-helix domain-containing protein n=1 Tax=Companilactobacillus mishanensis TaxID=2486008 RepID=UPI001297DC99|nr:helix-turn-helix transcriptional regulator [Companilactobacillus mishanensis]MQS89247.1 helix-turn-helix transcriptional regulator [Companilactobacillus mishanensis]
MKISEQIRTHRKSNKMSQQELADKLHISRQSISKWENGTALPSFANIVTISELFDVSLDELIKGDDNLKDHLEEKMEPSNVVGILSIAFPLAILIFILLSISHVGSNVIEDIRSLITMVSFLGVAFTLKWHYINKAFSKASFIWAVIFFIGLFMALMPAIEQGIVQAIVEEMKGIKGM